ncbi:hypothetical protein F5X68DRAFT_212290 [Plectosphaerella plurivora]|uniref:Uncharacterized protein n=1 Tax=Plectosphaerella plurivora TaxID=936078 RepID=A0A9P9A636_9PEZI|nr:hypothetical protein F5X68DRAFT_212290 [Plectosphaerella plurivora]
MQRRFSAIHAVLVASMQAARSRTRRASVAEVRGTVPTYCPGRRYVTRRKASKTSTRENIVAVRIQIVDGAGGRVDKLAWLGN